MTNTAFTHGWYVAMKHKAQRLEARRRARAAMAQYKIQCIDPAGWAFAWGALAGATVTAIYACLACV